MWTRTVDCVGLSVAIRSDVPAIDGQLAAVFRTYADATRDADLHYRLALADWPILLRDEQVVARHDTPIDLVAALELDLYAQVTQRASGLVLHAAAVVGANGRALVFAGASGAGKSTLVRAFLADGFRYLTEECVALSAHGACRGLARALHVNDPSVAVPAGFTCEDYVLRATAGERCTRLFHPPASIVWRGDARAAAVVAISHADDAPDALEHLSTGAALAALWPAIFRRDAKTALDASALLGDVVLYALRTTTPAHARELALALASELDVRAS